MAFMQVAVLSRLWDTTPHQVHAGKPDKGQPVRDKLRQVRFEGLPVVILSVINGLTLFSWPREYPATRLLPIPSTCLMIALNSTCDSGAPRGPREAISD